MSLREKARVLSATSRIESELRRAATDELECVNITLTDVEFISYFDKELNKQIEYSVWAVVIEDTGEKVSYRGGTALNELYDELFNVKVEDSAANLAELHEQGLPVILFTTKTRTGQPYTSVAIR